MFSLEDITHITELYDQGNSPYQIAEKYNTYPNKIRRILKEQGRQMRSKSEAQKIALATGRTSHPTKGTTRSSDVKQKISNGVFDSWQNISDEERQRRSEMAQEQWQNMSEMEKDKLRQAAIKSIRKASKEGSKIEKYLYSELSKRYNILFHNKQLIINTNLEVDLFIPELKIAIEIDGFSHFKPIWGEESLQKQRKSDYDKAGLLIGSGFVLIRLTCLAKTISQKYKRDVLELLLLKIKEIENSFPPRLHRLIELKV